MNDSLPIVPPHLRPVLTADSNGSAVECPVRIVGSGFFVGQQFLADCLGSEAIRIYNPTKSKHKTWHVTLTGFSITGSGNGPALLAHGNIRLHLLNGFIHYQGEASIQGVGAYAGNRRPAPDPFQARIKKAQERRRLARKNR